MPSLPLVIAAGHSTTSSGAVERGRKESDQNIDIVNRVEAKLGPIPAHAGLPAQPAQVRVVRVQDTLDTEAEWKWINDNYPTLNSCYAASIHKNSDVPTAHGVEGFYHVTKPKAAESSPGYAPCKTVVDRLATVGLAHNRGTKRDDEHPRMAWLHNVKPVAGLFEVGFLSGPLADCTTCHPKPEPDRTWPPYPLHGDHLFNDLWAEALTAGFLAMYGLTDKRKVLYRVRNAAGQQTNAFRVRAEAWAEYVKNGKKGSIVTLQGDTDVTPEFAVQFGGAWKPTL